MLVVLFVSPRWRKKERKTESLCGTATRRKPRTHTEMKAQMCKWYRRRAGPPISPKVLVGLYQVLRVEGMNQDGQVETKRKGVLITMAAIINWALMRTAFLFHSLSLCTRLENSPTHAMLIKMFCSVTLVIFPCAAYQRAISVSVLLPNRHCFFFFFFWELNKIAKRPRQFGVLCIWFQRTLLWCWQVRETYRCFSLEATITHPSVWKNNNKKNSRHFFPSK